MTILTSTSDVIRVVTGSAVANIEVQASWTDLSSGTYTPGSTETEISTATTTTVVAAPGASTYRRVKGLTIRNNHASSSNVVTVQKYNGTIAADLVGVTLLAGETLSRDDDGGWRHITAAGGVYKYAKPRPGNMGITGTLAETNPREVCIENNSSAISTGQLRLEGIYLYAGTVINSISFFSATTAAGTPTNQIFAIYNKVYQLQAQTANNTTTAWAANTIKTLALTAAWTVPVTDFYYLGIMVTATTVPTLKSASRGSALSAFFPHLGGNSTSGLTTTLPNPCAALTSGSSVAPWGCVT